MAHLYISTDTFEASQLIDPRETKNYKYHELKISDGKKLKEKIGFNPMSSVEFNGSISPKDLTQIAKELVKIGLFVAVDSEGKIERFIPKDMEARDLLCRLAVQPNFHDFYRNGSMQFMLLYSNNPNKIREEIPSRFY